MRVIKNLDDMSESGFNTSQIKQISDCINKSIKLAVAGFNLKKKGIPPEKLQVLYEKIDLCETQRDILISELKQSKQERK